MNRTEELRQQMIECLETDAMDYETMGRNDYSDDCVSVNIITIRRTIELLKRLEVPIEAKWQYYTNDEGRARWRCTNCGKVIRHGAHDKLRCSCCGAYMTMEA